MSDPVGPLLTPNDQLRSHLARAVETAQLTDPEPADRHPTSASRKRAWRNGRGSASLATIALVQDDDVLRWVYDPPSGSSRGRRRRAASSAPGETQYEFQFLEVPPNQFVKSLQDLDAKLTPSRDLRRWTDTGLQAVHAPTIKGSTLLLVHGTFSKGDMFFEELNAPGFADGANFLKSCLGAKGYEAILTFDHPTLSVSPWINALDLDRATANVSGPIDVVCHSRGGLVTAWWLSQKKRNVRKVVFVGSPLQGTGLASPFRIKAALDLLANYARAIGTVTSVAQTAVPMLAVASGLMKIVGGLLSFGARTPLVDAGVALVPGLAAQSRVSNNLELDALFAAPWATVPEIFAIQSNFEPAETQAPWWKFWKRFRNLGGQAADWGADALFDGPNDLVVDTPSMIQVGHSLVPKDHRLTFATEDAVHHCAYFRQEKTVGFLRETLGV